MLTPTPTPQPPSPIEITGIGTLIAGAGALLVAVINAFGAASKSQVDALAKAVKVLQGTVDDLQEEKDRISGENKDLRTSLKEQDQQLVTLRARVDTLETERTGNVQQIAALTLTNTNQSEKIAAQAERICFLEGENTRLKTENQQTQERLVKLEHRRKPSGPKPADKS